MIDRRTVLGAAALPLAAKAGPALAPEIPDEAYWAGIAGQYDVTRAVAQLEHGNWGMMARPVLATYRAMVEHLNRDTSFYARRDMVGDLLVVQKRLAEALGVGTDEIAFTRNATEAMKTLIGGYNRLRAGDAILYADLDYDSMQSCCETLVARRGVKVIRIALPEPATHQSLIDAYAAAFDRNPAIRMVLLTHVSHRTGLVLPVREIAALARSRGADAIVDAAHGIGQLDIALPDLGADFVGLNLHKWMGAPLGVGALYIRRGRLVDVDRDLAVGANEPDDIHARIHTGTVDYAAQLTVPAALDFQQAIGGANRERRLRALRDSWVAPLREDKRIEILTPEDPRLHCGITSFRLRGRTSHDENVALAKRLLDRHRIFTVHRDGVATGSCIRVTPSLASRSDDPDRLAAALRQILAES
ncbi:MAG: aminotransferase class V-fold PLP-dependent enzyme [Sphingomonas sp.]|jgi:selenocysteine lyase/cysteine desulfurase|uniref:aminotransferase class V-fold PLP-dependent enzyme n=1 Tax=Sphingomonas sp. TaxID=28214 RepID=UPI003565246F